MTITATIIIVCLALHKLKLCNVSHNRVVEESMKSSNGNPATVTKASCKPVLHTQAINAEFGGITKLQQSTDWDSKLDVEQNVAYGSSNGTWISFISNVAYYNSGKPPDMDTEENVAYGLPTDDQISLTSNTAYTGKNPGGQFEESRDHENEYDYIQ